MVKTEHARALLDQRQHRVERRRRDAGHTAKLLDDRNQRVDLHRPVALEVLQHRRLVGAHLPCPVDAAFDVDAEMHAERSPIAFASSIIARATARVPGSEAMTSSVACVRALIGLKQRLPHSFSQISSRMLSITGAFSPAAANRSDKRLARSVDSPDGSPSGNLSP